MDVMGCPRYKGGRGAEETEVMMPVQYCMKQFPVTVERLGKLSLQVCLLEASTCPGRQRASISSRKRRRSFVDAARWSVKVEWPDLASRLMLRVGKEWRSKIASFPL